MLNSETLWEELSQYFLTKYWNPDLPWLHNIPNNVQGYQVVLVIAAILLGISAASYFAVFQKRVIGELPRKLIAAGANTPEEAKTLAELGIRNRFLLRNALKNPTGGLRKYIRYNGEVSVTYEDMSRKGFHVPPLDTANAKFYLPDEKKEIAERRYQDRGDSFWNASFVTLGCIVLFFVLCRFLPKIMSLVDTVAGFLPG